MDPKSFIDDFSAYSPFEIFYENGMTQEDIRKGIIETFLPYFKNKDKLEEYSIKYLISGWALFLKLQNKPWHFEIFTPCLELFNVANSKNNDESIIILVNWLSEIHQSLNRFWSFKYMACSNDELSLDDFLEEQLRIIGQFIEGLIKPYLKLTLSLNRLVNERDYSFDKIKSLNLGNVINQLISNTNFPELLTPPPLNIKLNELRNIAYHHNAKIESDKIICWYGKEPKIKTIYLSRDELLQTTQTVIDIYNIFRVIEIIFIFDNLEKYQSVCKSKSISFKLRDEVNTIELFSGINSQGFKIINFSNEKEKAELILQDLTSQDKKERSIHSSQFLYQLWYYTSSKYLFIEYRLRDGTPYFRSSTKESVCKKIANEEESFSYLAENFEFSFL